MANNYLQFSETLDNLTLKEVEWIRSQLATVREVDGILYDEDKELPDGRNPTYEGLRFLYGIDKRKWNVDDPEWLGFQYQFMDGDTTFWVYGEESGNPDAVALFMQKFLKTWRPNDAWGFAYAETCSKMRRGEFGGGAVFVTARSVRYINAGGWLSRQLAIWDLKHKKPKEQQ